MVRRYPSTIHLRGLSRSATLSDVWVPRASSTSARVSSDNATYLCFAATTWARRSSSSAWLRCCSSWCCCSASSWAQACRCHSSALAAYRISWRHFSWFLVESLEIVQSSWTSWRWKAETVWHLLALQTLETVAKGGKKIAGWGSSDAAGSVSCWPPRLCPGRSPWCSIWGGPALCPPRWLPGCHPERLDRPATRSQPRPTLRPSPRLLCRLCWPCWSPRPCPLSCAHTRQRISTLAASWPG